MPVVSSLLHLFAKPRLYTTLGMVSIFILGRYRLATRCASRGLSKEQLGAFLTFLNLPASSREIKTNLVQHLLTRLEVDKTASAQFFEVFAFELAVPPWELEMLLGCTTTERKRWTEEQKLPVLGYGSFRKAGSDHAYAVHDRRVILTLTSSDIEAWRSEHQVLVRERRNAATQAAAAGRKAKRHEEQMAHEG